MKKKGKRRIEGSTDFGHAIRELRETRGLTLHELAQLVDSSATHLSAIERGKVTNPGIEILARIARALDCDLILTGPSRRSEPSGALAYESPFALDSHAEPRSVTETVNLIARVCSDERLSTLEQEHVAEESATFAEWLRDRILRRRGVRE